MNLLNIIILSCQVGIGGHGSNIDAKGLVSLQKEIMVEQQTVQQKCVKDLILCARNGLGSIDEIKLLSCLSK